MSTTYKFTTEERTKMQKVCDFFKLGEIKYCFFLPLTASCESLYRGETNKGNFQLKEYPIQKKIQLENANKIKNFFASQKIPLSLSSSHDKDLLFEFKNRCWQSTPWVEGKILSFNEVTKEHVEIIARLLAKIHEFGIKLLPLNSNILCDRVMDTDLRKENERFANFCKRFESQVFLLNENQVVSHGDVLPQNVVWTSNNSPVLIDWDNAGCINQDIELFNTAINWAGIESDVFNRFFYDLFLRAYFRVYPRKVCIDKALVAASLGSWLNWWSDNHQKGNKQAVQTTIRALERISEEFL